ncbi:hypothetical protein SLE2022_398670 [Rubroshorea leprosula]
MERESWVLRLELTCGVLGLLALLRFEHQTPLHLLLDFLSLAHFSHLNHISFLAAGGRGRLRKGFSEERRKKQVNPLSSLYLKKPIGILPFTAVITPSISL